MKYLTAADPECGRFRAFLITAFKHYLSQEWEQARAKKRGGGLAPFPLDFAWHDSHSGGPATNLTAEQLYERQWAITLLDRVMRRLRSNVAELKGSHCNEPMTLKILPRWWCFWLRQVQGILRVNRLMWTAVLSQAK